MTLSGKVVLVTGATGGIGRATALALAAAGAKLALADVSMDGGEDLARQVIAEGGEAAFTQADVTQSDEVEAMVAFAVGKFGGLDCAFNNAGVGGGLANISDIEEDLWDRIMAVNARGVWLCMKYEIPVMVSNGGGSIVNMSSVAGLVGARGMGAYAASKHAVVGLTRTAAVEGARMGVRVNAVCPSFVRTDMVEPLTRGTPEGEKQLTRGVPFKRLGNPEEVAAAVVWLCSDAASFVTGQALAIDGGLTAQ